MLQRNLAILILLQGKKIIIKNQLCIFACYISKQSGKISYMWNNANKIVPHN